ncbi:putative calcium-binding protein CML48 [Apostasia shenzhenica]|uniref:Putative calcium-binding protein CML48 n=1 Tax=Apostasia shenzhenica TaxID=1088818 RepID=A0A2I0BD90_9ASPA|nr:putative calcium-binding protein CML48 [Apostasia shenzhenica]
MSSDRYPSNTYAPSAPPMPPSSSYAGAGSAGVQSFPAGGSSHPTGKPVPQTSYTPPSYGHVPLYSQGSLHFPPGTHPEIVRSFHAVDLDRSGFIEETELQAALSSGYQKFSVRTIRLLMFLFGKRTLRRLGLLSLQLCGIALGSGGLFLIDLIETEAEKSIHLN